MVGAAEVRGGVTARVPDAATTPGVADAHAGRVVENRPRDVRVALALTPFFPFVALAYAGGLSIALLLIVVYVFAAIVFGQTGLTNIVAGAWLGVVCFGALMLALYVLPAWLASERRERFRPRWYNHWIFYAIFGALTTGLYFVSGSWRAQLYGFSIVRLAETGMTPTLRTGDVVVVDTRASTLAALRRGDVVVYESAAKPGAIRAQRVFGLPSQRVQIEADGIRVAGSLVEPAAPGALFEPVEFHDVELAYDQYYFIGDARAASVDSRREGPVPQRNVRGKVTIVWPSGERGRLKRIDARE